MNDVIDIIIQFFNTLWNFKILNVSVVIWASIPVIIGLFMDLIKGKKE